MNNFNLKKLIEPLASINLSEQEKGSLKLRVLDYMRSNPAPERSGIAVIKYFSTAALSLVVVLGSGSLITSASQQSLPGQLLYPIKRAAEHATAKTIIEPQKKIDYSLSLIEKRYTETNQLLAQQSLNDQTESAITTDIQKHITDIQNQAETIAQTNPAEALSYNIKLAKALKTNTQVFLAVSEKNQSIKKTQPTASTDHTKLVLAAYENTAKISLKTEQLQQVILSDTDIITIKTAEKKYHEILPKIAEALADTESVTVVLPIDTPEPVKEIVPEITKKQHDVIIIPEQNDLITQKTEVVAPIQKINTSETVATLAKKLDDAYAAKKYNRVIVLADQIDQMIEDTKKIKDAEQKYDIIVPTIIESDTATTDIKQESASTSTEIKKITDRP